MFPSIAREASPVPYWDDWNALTGSILTVSDKVLCNYKVEIFIKYKFLKKSYWTNF